MNQCRHQQKNKYMGRTVDSGCAIKPNVTDCDDKCKQRCKMFRAADVKLKEVENSYMYIGM